MQITLNQKMSKYNKYKLTEGFAPLIRFLIIMAILAVVLVITYICLAYLADGAQGGRPWYGSSTVF